MTLEEVENEASMNADPESQEQENGGIQSVDYHSYSLEELIKAMDAFCTKDLVESHRKEIEEIRSLFYKKQKQEFDEARRAYMSEHGTLDGFSYESKENELKDVYGRVKELRSVIVAQREKEQKKNLEAKQRIIERIEQLTQAPESMNKTFAEFRALQEEWKNTGEAPAQEEKTIWEKYHLQVAKFYDYVKIDRELRDLDQKKNYEAKVALCEAAEKLVGAKQIIPAFNELQALHDEWKKIGPVKEEFKEQLWERFKTATTAVNKAHQDYFVQRKQQETENFEKKSALCEKIESINANLESLTLKQWTSLTTKIQEIQKEWKTIGFAPQKQNNQIYERYTAACDVFFSARKTFMNEVHGVENDNKKQKIALCEKAEAMQTRTDWKDATNDFIELQKAWKQIGSSGFKYSQKLWNRFSGACNAFFEAKKAYEAGQEAVLNENISLKEALIAKVSDISTDVKEDALKAITAVQDEWSKIQVPSASKADLQKRFNDAVSQLMGKMNVEKGSFSDMAFNIKMSSLMTEKNGREKVMLEAKRIKNKLSSVKTEILSLENNIGFFSKSSDASRLIASVEKNIQKSKDEVVQLEKKLKIINKILQE
ncbi:MAG: DUF349 domain-containing protein [Bacteroidales bacterium]|nr:DUF349 domain-containing protein [Bacteroidales bacterium]